VTRSFLGQLYHCLQAGKHFNEEHALATLAPTQGLAA
jgi:hypothetical protein